MATTIDKQTLKTVSLAVAKKSSQQILEHFCFYDGRVQCFDSTVAIDAPFESDLSITAPVKQFMAAIEGAGEVTLSVNKKLTIKTDKLRTSFGFLSIDDFPKILPPSDKKSKIKAPILDALKKLRSFIDTNSMRTWSTGILIADGHGYATDNVIMVRDVIPGIPRCVLPARAIDLLIKINKEPTHYLVTDNIVYFWFDDMWLRSALIDDNWPDAAGVIDKSERNNVFDIASIKDDLSTLSKFDTTKGMSVVEFNGTEMALNDHISDVHIKCDADESKFNLELLMKVSNSASIMHVNWPSPCYFEQGTFEGVIVGVK